MNAKTPGEPGADTPVGAVGESPTHKDSIRQSGDDGVVSADPATSGPGQAPSEKEREMNAVTQTKPRTDVQSSMPPAARATVPDAGDKTPRRRAYDGPSEAQLAHYRFLHSLPQFSLRVTDAKMDCGDPSAAHLRPADYLMCVSIKDWPRHTREIGPGYDVIVYNWRNGVVEVLCREIVERDGNLCIAPLPGDALPAGSLDRVTLVVEPATGSAKSTKSSDGGPPSDGLYVAAVVVGRSWCEPFARDALEGKAKDTNERGGDL